MAAATTAAMGLKTLVLEKHNLPGGSASSFRRGRFEFEPSLHELNGYGPPEHPGDVRNMFNKLGVDIELLPVADAYRTIITGAGGYDAVLPIGREAYTKAVESYAPGSSASVKAFWDLTDDCTDAINYIGASGGKPDPQVMGRDHMNFMKVAAASINDVFDALKMPQRAKEILSTYWCYIGMPGSVFDFLMFSQMMDKYITYSPFVPKQRSHEISSAIEKRIYDFGGDVWYNTPATGLKIVNGQIEGVDTPDGFIACKHVISNASPSTVFGKLVDPALAPVEERKRANARQLGASALCVYLGIDKSPEELGIKDYSVFISSTPDSDEQFRRMTTMDQNDFMIMNCLNIANPEASPKGTSLLWATQLYRGDTWKSVTPQNYKREKEKIARRVIEQYEKAVGVKIHDNIEEIEVAAPQTFARYLGSPEGSIYGYQGQLFWDNLLARTMTMQNENWVKGLRFAGGHQFRLDGYSSCYISGNTTGGLTAMDIKKEGK
jgi:prolycopene isomerase